MDAAAQKECCPRFCSKRPLYVPPVYEECAMSMEKQSLVEQFLHLRTESA